ATKGRELSLGLSGVELKAETPFPIGSPAEGRRPLGGARHDVLVDFAVMRVTVFAVRIVRDDQVERPQIDFRESGNRPTRIRLRVRKYAGFGPERLAGVEELPCPDGVSPRDG